MRIKLLHPVLHDGHRIEAGQTGDVDPAIAEKLIASGAAVAVEEPEPAPVASNAAPKEPEPLLQPEAGQPVTTPTPLVDAKTAGNETMDEPAPAAEPEPVTETKPAKGKEGK